MEDLPFLGDGNIRLGMDPKRAWAERHLRIEAYQKFFFLFQLFKRHQLINCLLFLFVYFKIIENTLFYLPLTLI